MPNVLPVLTLHLCPVRVLSELLCLLMHIGQARCEDLQVVRIRQAGAPGLSPVLLGHSPKLVTPAAGVELPQQRLDIQQEQEGR
jgi:hypothetical protein